MIIVQKEMQFFVSLKLCVAIQCLPIQLSFKSDRFCSVHFLYLGLKMCLCEEQVHSSEKKKSLGLIWSLLLSPEGHSGDYSIEPVRLVLRQSAHHHCCLGGKKTEMFIENRRWCVFHLH